MLLESGARLDLDQNRSALHNAAKMGHFDVVQLLLDHKADINHRDDTGTALYLAVKHGQFEMARYLIANGADVNAANVDGRTPIIAATAQGNLMFVKELVKIGADVRCFKHDHNALFQAAKSGHIDLIHYFITELGLSVNTEHLMEPRQFL